mmetsp:Transcript_47658/g.149071  ORF Transcript_47658/g.149071 Transcript_47658/m.149071 type:complete len:201 (-) Transcript_47658:126-728(-)
MPSPVVVKKKRRVGCIDELTSASSCRRSSLPVKTSPPLQTTKPVMTHASIGSRLGAVTPSGTSSWSSRPCAEKAAAPTPSKPSCGRGGTSGTRSASKQSAARSNPSRADAASSAATRGTNMEHKWAAAAAGWPPERVTGWDGSVSVCASSVVAEKSRITCGAGSREGSRWARQPRGGRGGKELSLRPTRPRPWSHRARSA